MKLALPQGDDEAAYREVSRDHSRRGPRAEGLNRKTGTEPSKLDGRSSARKDD